MKNLKKVFKILSFLSFIWFSEFFLSSKLFTANKAAMTKVSTEIAILAGGCFWGVEELLGKFPGVVSTRVGYTGGITKLPTYEEVKLGNTGHAEAVEVVFDPLKTSYRDILFFFFKLHDPTTVDQQGNDRGSQYRSAIFYSSQDQKKIAESVIAHMDAKGVWKKKIVTQVIPASQFYEAENYHQDYLQKNPGGYTCHFVRDFSL